MINRQAYPVPLLKVALAWCLGIVLSRYLAPQLLPWVLGLSGVLVALYVFTGAKTRSIIIILIICALGILRTGLFPPAESPLTQVLSSRHYLRQQMDFKVLRLVSEEFHSYEIKLTKLAGVSADEKLLVYAGKELQGEASYRMMGDITMIVQDPLLDIFPGKYPAKVYPVGLIHKTHDGGFSVALCRGWLLQNLDANIGEGAGFAKALLLSDVSGQKGFRDQLKRGGIVHLIVVSGLHVWFIYAMVMVLLNFFLPKRLCEIFFLILITFFAALNNWAPPIMRSILMISMFISAKWLSRPVSLLQIMAASLLMITVYNPQQLFSVSLVLSYISVTTILLAVPRITFFQSGGVMRIWIGKQVEYILISILVGLSLLPITLYYFGTGSLNGILGNLLGIPLLALIMPLAFILMFVPAGFGLLSIFKTSYLGLVSLFYAWTAFNASLPLYIQSRFLSIAQAWAMILCLIMLFLLVRGRWKVLKYMTVPALITISALVFLPPLLQKDEPRLEIFNCGVADCSLLTLEDDQTIMIDTGGVFGNPSETENLSSSDMLNNSWLGSKLLPHLARTGVRDIDWLIITHMHSDHYGGLASLTKSLKVKHIICDQASIESQAWQELAAAGFFKHSTIHAVSDTTSFQVASARIKILHPDRNFYQPELNNRSVITRIDYRAKSYLFCGDIESEGEEHLLRHYPDQLKADYLKVGHHGSKTSSSLEFLKAVRPREAWITVSLRNRYHFPAPVVLERFQKLGIPVRQTATGSIVVPL